MTPLKERANKARQQLLNEALQKKGVEGADTFSLSKQQLNKVETKESDDVRSLQQSTSSNMVEIKPGIKIPNREYSCEELLAIAERFHDPNTPYVVSMIFNFNTDGSVIKKYSDGSVVVTSRKSNSQS